MKIRTDFVTNSSSSSYTINLEIELVNKSSIDLSLFRDPESGGFWNLGIKSSKFKADVLGKAGSINDLIDYINKGIYYEVFGWDEEADGDGELFFDDDKKPISTFFEEADPQHFDEETNIVENKEFFSELRKTNIADIKKITISQESYGHGGDDWGHEQSYDLKTGAFKYDEDDKLPDWFDEG